LKKPGTGDGRAEPLYIDEKGLSKEHFMLPPHYVDSIDRLLVPYGFVVDRIERLAWDIKTTYGNEDLHLICVLKGSRGFFNHLLNALNRIHMYQNRHTTSLPFYEHYVRLKSYKGMQSTGELTVIAEDLSVLEGKHVLVVEDIIDTGTTLTKFAKYLEDIKPRSVGVASLTEKRTTRSSGFKGDFVGFSIPDEFVVGFGLDYNEIFRDLDHICVISKSGIEKFAKVRQGAH